MDKYIDKIQKFFTENPAALAALIAALGLTFLLGSILNWNWLFGDVSPATYSIGKLDGLINLFGRKAARIIFGAIGLFIFIIGAAIAWNYLTIKH